MKIGIKQPVGFTEVGQRANNEDCIYPPRETVTAETRLFMVCDGVGGQLKGEAASALACESIANYFQMNPVAISDAQYIQAALKFTTENFKVREAKEKETQGMATTLTLLHLNDAGATLAHLGDSRIYQVRDGSIIFVTEDHKLVNELVRDGHITEQEALTHSQRNVITKVISADRNDVPDVSTINDIAEGDYFFLCSDGVLEQIYDDLLTYHLRETDDNNVSDDEKLENIRRECIGRTRDNFSAILIRVNTVAGGLSGAKKTPIPEQHLKPSPRLKPTDIRVNYENDAPTSFTRSTTPNPGNVEPTNQAKTLRYTTAALVVVLSVVAAVWYKKSADPVAPVNTLAIQDTITTASPVAIIEELPKTVKPAPAVKEKKEIAERALPADTIAFSAKYKFLITKEDKNYFLRESGKKSRASIEYNELVSIPGVVHCYRFKNAGIHYLYLVKPDVRIQNIDPSEIETGANEIVYVSKGIEHRIDPGTGNALNPSVKELRKDLEEQTGKQP
jgi:serine/threonine protein phosphatase PrpC